MPRTAKKTTPAPAREFPAGRLETVPIDDVHAGAGVRSAVVLDDGFVRSVRENGVLQPLLVAPNGSGYRLVAGRRRLAAAVACGLPVVPVIVRDDLEGRDELVAEIVENVQRANLTPAEEAAAYEQLAAFDMDELAIAAATGSDVERIGWGLRLAKAPKVRGALAKTATLTLQQAGAIAEFEEDEPNLKRLMEVIRDRPAQLDHAVAQLQEEREIERKRAAEIARLEKAGVTILEPDKYGHRPATEGVTRLSELVGADGKDLNGSNHRKCPGHAAFVPTLRYFGYEKTAYYCTDPKGNGHKSRWGGAVRGATSEADREQKSAERRTTIANNKAWRAATTVRTKFVRELCARTKPPKGSTMLVFALRQAIAHHDLIGEVRDEKLAEYAGVTVAGHDPGGYFRGEYCGQGSGPWVAAAVRAESDGLLALFHLVATGMEMRMSPPDTWRGATIAKRDWLNFLVSEGYTLSEIEAQVAKEPEPKPSRSRPATRAERQDAINREAEAAATARTGERCTSCGRDPESEAEEVDRDEDWHMVSPELCSVCDAGDLYRGGGAPDDAGDACRLCGCTEDAACEGGCSWHGADEPDVQLICTACVAKIERGEATDPLGLFKLMCTSCERDAGALAELEVPFAHPKPDDDGPLCSDCAPDITCRVCSCTDEEPCEDGKVGTKCRWVADPKGQGDLCSRCLPFEQAGVDEAAAAETFDAEGAGLSNVDQAALDLLLTRELRESNATSPDKRTLYWQTGKRLEGAGLIARTSRDRAQWFSLTEQGRRVAEQLAAERKWAAP